jgi:hypothetical protein
MELGSDGADVMALKKLVISLIRAMVLPWVTVILRIVFPPSEDYACH